MARRPKINETSIAKLGAKRLAALLIAEAARNKSLKQALQLTLDSEAGAGVLASTIRKRLNTISRAQSNLSTQKSRELATELDRMRESIVAGVGPTAPKDAADLLWQLLDLHVSVIERCDYQSNATSDVFSTACDDLGTVMASTSIPPTTVADQVYPRLMDNHYDVLDGLLEVMAESLGSEGLEALQRRVRHDRDVRLAERAKQEKYGNGQTPVEFMIGGRRAYGFSSQRFDPVLSRLRHLLCDIADLRGDVDAYIAALDDEEKTTPTSATQIAARLIKAERFQEALDALDTGAPSHDRPSSQDIEWLSMRALALDGVGRPDDAQAIRWQAFETHLEPEALRDYLKVLPDFDDIEVEEKALDGLLTHPGFHSVLSFFLDWPDLPRAAHLIESRADALNGDYYQLLGPAADALEGKHPLAAALVRRAMIDFTLLQARSSRYRHAARHLMEAASLHVAISDYGSHETHDDYAARLRTEHGRKHGFWSKVAEA